MTSSYNDDDDFEDPNAPPPPPAPPRPPRPRPDTWWVYFPLLQEDKLGYPHFIGEGTLRWLVGNKIAPYLWDMGVWPPGQGGLAKLPSYNYSWMDEENNFKKEQVRHVGFELDKDMSLEQAQRICSWIRENTGLPADLRDPGHIQKKIDYAPDQHETHRYYSEKHKEYLKEMEKEIAEEEMRRAALEKERRAEEERKARQAELEAVRKAKETAKKAEELKKAVEAAAEKQKHNAEMQKKKEAERLARLQALVSKARAKASETPSQQFRDIQRYTRPSSKILSTLEPTVQAQFDEDVRKERADPQHAAKVAARKRKAEEREKEIRKRQRTERLAPEKPLLPNNPFLQLAAEERSKKQTQREEEEAERLLEEERKAKGGAMSSLLKQLPPEILIKLILLFLSQFRGRQ